MTLPPLPEPAIIGVAGFDDDGMGYTADQMRDYARAAVAQEQANHARVLALQQASYEREMALDRAALDKVRPQYDWSLLEATQGSLREHMAEIRTLRAALAQQPAQAHQPLTQAQVLRMFNGPGVSASDRFKLTASVFTRVWMLCEAAHGIK